MLIITSNKLVASQVHEMPFLFTFLIMLGKVFGNEVPFLFTNKICATDDCKQIGYDIYSSINISSDPCKNFYEFSCGNWISLNKKPNFEPMWNHHLSTGYKINKRIQLILRESDKVDRSSALGKTVSFYKTCCEVDKEKDDQYLENLRKLAEKFTGFSNTNKRVSNGRILLEIAKISKSLKIHPILKMSVNLDYKNTSHNAIYIEPGTLVYPIHILVNSASYALEMNAYRRWMFETFAHLYRHGSKSNIKVSRIIEFEIKLAKIMRRAKLERSTMREVSNKLNTNFSMPFNFLYHNENNSLSDNQVVVVKNFHYLKSLLVLLKRTDLTVIDNYLLWTIVKDLSRETTKYMRNLNFVVDQVVLGVESDLSRKTECINKIKEYFGRAIVSKYVEKYFNDDTMENVKKMIKHIKIEFMKLVADNVWLSEETKLLAVEKINSIREYIGFPQEFAEKELVEKYFIDFNITDDHFANTVNIKEILAKKHYSNLNKIADVQWPSHIFEVNAFYSILQNIVFIPLGLLEPPFFYKKGPSYLNYGALGSLIGHEISHSLDSTGRHANKDGIISKWWPESDIQKFQLNTRCFINQYNSYNMNGFVTVGENIADNVGLQIALNAYNNIKNEKFEMLPFMETFSNKQMFFISFAQMWCEISNRVDAFYEEHSSVMARVNGTITNSKTFKYDFNCVHRNNQCLLW